VYVCVYIYIYIYDIYIYIYMDMYTYMCAHYNACMYVYAALLVSTFMHTCMC
jgi:hypothetical protein